jgi:hypothetical protein
MLGGEFNINEKLIIEMVYMILFNLPFNISRSPYNMTSYIIYYNTYKSDSFHL